MSKGRKRKRDICFIRVLSEGIPGQVRDITRHGLKITIMEKAAYQVGEIRDFVLLPDESFNISPLMIKGKIRWVKKDNLYETYGIDLEGLPNDEDSLEEIVKQWAK